jgi:hypothetical protein
MIAIALRAGPVEDLNLLKIVGSPRPLPVEHRAVQLAVDR